MSKKCTSLNHSHKKRKDSHPWALTNKIMLNIMQTGMQNVKFDFLENEWVESGVGFNFHFQMLR